MSIEREIEWSVLSCGISNLSRFSALNTIIVEPAIIPAAERVGNVITDHCVCRHVGSALTCLHATHCITFILGLDADVIGSTCRSGKLWRNEIINMLGSSIFRHQSTLLINVTCCLTARSRSILPSNSLRRTVIHGCPAGEVASRREIDRIRERVLGRSRHHANKREEEKSECSL